MQKYNSMLLYVQHVWYTRFWENQNAFEEEKMKFFHKGNEMIPSSDKRSKDQDKELITKEYEGCQGHATQK